MSLTRSRKMRFKKKQTRKSNKGSFKKMTCSPLSEEYKKGTPTSAHATCLPSHVIYRARDYWNQANPRDKIVSKNPDHIWSEIQKRLNGTCDDDFCILEQPFMKKLGSKTSSKTTTIGRHGGVNSVVIDKKLKDYYSPKMPKEWKRNPTEWLSSIEILEKMKQYEEAYPCFEFIGPTSIDFDKVLHGKVCVEKELCNFQLWTQIKRKKKKIGIIFNTDPHDKGGSHWISMFINIPKKIIFFFDSAGDPAPEEIMNFVKRIQEQGRSLNPPIEFKFDQNHPHEHQYSSTECGMYSLYFIINMLEDKLTTKYLKTHVIPDERMIEYRKKYFNDV